MPQGNQLETAKSRREHDANMASVACKLLPPPLACLVVITLITATFASLACILLWFYLHSACDNRNAEVEAEAAWEKLHSNREWGGGRGQWATAKPALVEPAMRIGWSDGTFAWPPPEDVGLPNIWQDK